MRILELKKTHLPKIAVLLTGLAAAILAVTMSPQAAHAYPSQAKNCAGCHKGGTSTATTATPSTTTPSPGATYTVAITLAANPAGGNSGYAIVPVAPDTQKTNAGNTASLTSYTATMTAPAAAGTYNYTVYTNMGSQAAGQTGSAVYSITVTGGSSVAPTSVAPTSVAPTSVAPTSVAPTSVAPVVDGIHGTYSLTTDKCGICHRVHTAKAPNLLAKGSQSNLGSQSVLCLACHDGTGAKPNVGLQYGLGQPANNAATREYYSHDAVGATPSKQHTDSQLNEFGSVDGAVAPLNRHSECADCHNPHKATASTTRVSTQYPDGWDISGRLIGVSGVSVTNSATPGDPPTAYAFLDGATNLVTREYQICFKCHSGFTKLTSNDAPLKPSQYALDKAIEFNPANPSFHPVEAAGTNDTDAMKASLAGASAYKLWDFQVTSTIRCLNCHASSETSGPNPPVQAVDPTLPRPEGALPPHTSANRGILLRNYRDRVLKSGTEAYAEMDFALCYVCHGSAPFAPDASSNPVAALQTNFQLHSKHLTGLQTLGSAGTDIDRAGDGQGQAICAECHFRLHSTTNKTPQGGDGSRLVNFAPNVQPLVTGSTPSWTRSTGGGSCTLTCHGVPHDGFGY